MPIQITHEVTIRIDIILLCLNPQYSSQKMKRNSHANVIIFSFSLIIYNDNNFHFIISFLLKAIRLCTNSFSIRLCLVFSISYNYSRYHFVVQFDKLSHSDILRLQQLNKKIVRYWYMILTSYKIIILIITIVIHCNRNPLIVLTLFFNWRSVIAMRCLSRTAEKLH